jgi:hypothetical protein
MVPWVHSFADLASIGIRTSQAQQQVVEEGGMVLCIARLPDYEICDCGADHGFAVEDEHGRPVMVPFVFKASSPWSVYGMPWKAETETIASVCEGNDPDWRLFPSYVGESHTEVVEPYWVGGELQIVRVWQGIPLTDPLTTAYAEQLIAGFRSWVAESAYEEMREMYFTERAFQDGAIDWDIDDLDDEDATKYRTLRAGLLERGFIIEDPDTGVWGDGQPVIFGPVEHHIENPASLALWRDLVRQSQRGAFAVLDTLPPEKKSLFVYNEKELEPWY